METADVIKTGRMGRFGLRRRPAEDSEPYQHQILRNQQEFQALPISKPVIDGVKPNQPRQFMKKTFLLIATLTAALGFAQAQEVVPQDEAMKASLALWYASGDLSDLALKVDPDIKYPYGVAKKDIGMIVIPETKVAEVLAKAGEKVLPIGQLWLKGLVPEVDGKTVADSDLKLVEVTVKEDSASVILFTLGVKKSEAKGLELVVYGKGKEPLLTAPFKAIKAKQANPIELEVVPGGGNAKVIIRVAGQQEASFAVGRQE